MKEKIVTLSIEKNVSLGNLLDLNESYTYLWLCELQKWLRDVHNIHIWLIPAEIDSTYRAYVGYGIKLDLLKHSFTQSSFKYEDALEEGLIMALELLPNK